MAALGILRVLVMGDTAQLTTSLQQAQITAQQAGQSMRAAFDTATGALGRFAGGMANLPTLILGAGLGLAMQQVLQFADSLDESAARLGLTTDAFQALGAQARESGASTQQFERGMASLNLQMGQATEGSKTAQKTFRDLGVSWVDVAGKTRTTEAVFRDVMTALGKIPNVADQATASAELFGAKAGPALVAAFRGGVEAMDAFEARAKAMGSILDKETIQNLSKLQDKLDQLSLRFQVIAANLMATLGPTFDAILDLINDTITGWQTLLAYFGLTQDTATSLWNKVADIDARLALIPAGMEGRRAELEKQREVLVQQVRLMEAQVKVQDDLAKKARLGPAAGAIPPPKAAAAEKSAAATWEAAAKAEQKVQDEANAARDKYYLEEEKKREAAAEERVKLAGETARQELAFEEEVNKIKTQYILDEEVKRQAASDARVARAYEVAQQEVKLQEEANEATNRMRMAQAAQLAAEEEARWKPVKDALASVERAVSTSVTGIIEGTQTAQQAFQKMGESIVLSIQETIIKRGIEAIGEALEEMLTKQNIQLAVNAVLRIFGGGAGLGASTSTLNIGDYGQAFAAEGGIVTRPTLTMTGEGGPEAIIPLDRWGELGGGGGNVTVNIIDQRKGGGIEQREKMGAGGPEIDVLITDVVRGGMSNGVFDQAMAGNYGVSRRGVAR